MSSKGNFLLPYFKVCFRSQVIFVRNDSEKAFKNQPVKSVAKHDLEWREEGNS